MLAAYQSSLDAELPTVVVDVGIDSSIVAAYSGHELMGVRVISAASEPGFARDLGWAVRTLETNAEHAVLGGRMYETAASIVASVPLVTCVPAGCIHAAPLTPELLKTLQEARDLSAVVTRLDGQSVGLQLSMRGFVEANIRLAMFFKTRS